jgi:hypothetical protein
VPDFIIQTNIAHYKDLLTIETDARKIAIIRRLLGEEEPEFLAKKPRPDAAE